MKNSDKAKRIFQYKIHITNTCWIWDGPFQLRMYGYTQINNIRFLAHRLSWYIYKGDIEEGKEVCHKCDNEFCVNPNHLFVAHHSTNLIDARDKGRLCQAKLNQITADSIRRLRQTYGTSIRNLAKDFGVHQSTIWRVINQEAWQNGPTT